MKFGNQDGTCFGFGSFGAGQTQAPHPMRWSRKKPQPRQPPRQSERTDVQRSAPSYRNATSTAGDVDSLSYLKVVLNQHDLDYCLLSTWCMAAEDILQLRQWYEQGRIRKLDMYLGEIFPGSYKIEWQMVKKFYQEHPEAGRAAVFKNHSKIYAGCNYDDGFYFGIQTSANINTNPRTEQGSITVDKGLFEFYKDYFDGIRSFEK